MRPPIRTRQVLRLQSPERLGPSQPGAILADPRALRVAGCTSALHPENVRPNGTKCSCRRRANGCAQASPADHGAAEGDERLMDVVADLPADAQAAEPAQQSDRSFRDPAVDAEAGAACGAAPGDVRNDLHGAEPVAIGLVVVAAVGIERGAR